jgi:hypothetical protein
MEDILNGGRGYDSGSSAKRGEMGQLWATGNWATGVNLTFININQKNEHHWSVWVQFQFTL